MILSYQRRIAVLEYAERVGNVAEACRVFGLRTLAMTSGKGVADRYGLAPMPRSAERPCALPRRPRTVPVLARHHEALWASATYADGAYVIGGRSPERRTVTTPLVDRLASASDLPRLDTGRLRATWLAACAERIGLGAFMEAAGITCSQRIGDIVATLAPLDEGIAVALLGGRR